MKIIKISSFFLVLALTFLISTNTAFAGGSGNAPMKVVAVDTTASGSFIIVVSRSFSSGSGGCTNNVLLVPSNRINKSEIYTSAITAMVNGNNVNVFVPTACDRNRPVVLNFNIKA